MCVKSLVCTWHTGGSCHRAMLCSYCFDTQSLSPQPSSPPFTFPPSHSIFPLLQLPGICWSRGRYLARGEPIGGWLRDGLVPFQPEMPVFSWQCWTQEAEWAPSLLEKADSHPSRVHPGSPKARSALPLPKAEAVPLQGPHNLSLIQEAGTALTG